LKKYLVEVISQHLVRYVVEAREESDAQDEVVMNMDQYNEDWKEFSQRHLGDTILSTREVDEEEIIGIFDRDNDYLATFPRENKLSLINVIEYPDKEIVPGERDWDYDGLGNKVYKGTMRAYDK